MTLTAVIFDMDETLVYGCDPETQHEIDIHYLSWQAVLKPYNVDIALEDYVTHMRGATNTECEAWLSSHVSVPSLTALSDAKEQHYRDVLLPVHLRYRPGATDALMQLQSRDVALGLLTNAPSGNVERVHDTLDLWRYIRSDIAFSIDSLQDQGFAPKPAADGLLEIARLLSVATQTMVYVGDSLGDMRAAKAAGVPGIGIVCANSASALLDAGAHHTIEHFGQLHTALEKIEAHL